MKINFATVLNGTLTQVLGELLGTMMPKNSANNVIKFVDLMNEEIKNYVEKSNEEYKEFFTKNEIGFKQSQFFLVPTVEINNDDKNYPDYQNLLKKVNTGDITFEWKAVTLNLAQVKPLWIELLQKTGYFKL